MDRKRPASESHPAKRVREQVELTQDCWSWVILWMDDMQDVASLRCTSKTLRNHVEHFARVVRPSLRTPLNLTSVINVDSGSAFLLPNGRLDGRYTSYLDKRNCDEDPEDDFHQDGTFWNGQLHGMCSESEHSRSFSECVFRFGKPWKGCWHSSYEKGVLYDDGMEVGSVNRGHRTDWYRMGPYLALSPGHCVVVERKEQPPRVEKRHVIGEHVPVYHYQVLNSLSHATTMVSSLVDAGRMTMLASLGAAKMAHGSPF